MSEFYQLKEIISTKIEYVIKGFDEYFKEMFKQHMRKCYSY